jgi:hypothetical protein
LADLVADLFEFQKSTEHLIVEENTVALVSWLLLERQRNQIAESSMG